tara:strand:+ start:64 stop:744 length:681 start_codon:yes stop_codon:yes gene_type:complete
MINQDLCVLTYDAPHRKTQELLLRLKLVGHHNVLVLATPWQERKNFKPLFPHRILSAHDITLSQVCENLGYNLEKINIDDLPSATSEKSPILIGGAGIIPKEVVESRNIINSHPAYLPYVRGLDSLKWAIYDGQPIGVTSHFVSTECDAGILIKRKLVPLFTWDTFHSIAHRQFDMEIDLLVNSLEDIKTSSLENLSTDYSPARRRMPHSKEIIMMKRLDRLIENA